MRSEVIADRYAQALLELAQKQGRAEAVLDQVDRFQKSVSALPQFGRFLESPRVSQETKEDLLRKVFEEEKGGILFPFVRLLLRKGRAGYLMDIFALYRRLYDAHRGVLKGNLTVAYPMDPAVIERLKSKLESALHQKLELTTVENSKILGGFIFSTGVTLVDASVRRELAQLGEKMKAPLSSRVLL